MIISELLKWGPLGDLNNEGQVVSRKIRIIHLAIIRKYQFS